MDQISNYNCHNKQMSCLCCEKFCDEVESQFIELDINGMKILLSFCDKHAEEFETKFWEMTNARN